MKALISSFALLVFASQAVAEEWVSVGASQRVAPAATSTVTAPASSSTPSAVSSPSSAVSSQASGSPDGGLMYEMWQQLEQLQQEVALLRSQVEIQQHQLQQFEGTQQQRYLDLDRRLSILTSRPESAAPTTPLVATQASSVEGEQAPTSSTSSRSAEQQYQEAMRLVRDREFDAAIGAFTAFIQQHGQHTLMPNALYWLAEVYLVQNENQKALTHFKRVMDTYPEHDKAADSMYKYAVTLHRQGDAVAAKQWLQTVIDRYSERSTSTVQLAKSYLSNLQ